MKITILKFSVALMVLFSFIWWYFSLAENISVQYKADIIESNQDKFFQAKSIKYKNKSIAHKQNNNKKKKKFIVVYKSDVKDVNIEKLEGISSSRLKRKHNIIPAISLDIDLWDVDKIKLDPDVKTVYEDIVVEAFLNDSISQINANQVHLDWTSWSGVRVCIIDTWIDKSHPALNLPVWEFDFVNNDNDSSDDNGHWTHVAWIIASNDHTYKWVAPWASLLTVKALDSQGSWWSSDIISAMDWCISQWVDVINMSLWWWAYVGNCDSEPLAQAANNASAQWLVVFAASWNDWYANAMWAPACASDVIAVWSVDKNKARTSYSNEGDQLDFVSPWSNITSAQLWSWFTEKSGTSMATPHWAWVAALLLEANSSLSPDSIRTIMRDTSLDLWSPWFDTIYWYWEIDAFWAYQHVINIPVEPEQIFFDDFQDTTFSNWIESNEFDWNIEKPSERQIPNTVSSNLVAHADKCSSSNGCILSLKNAIDLSLYESASLDFWRYLDNWLDNWEFLEVQLFDWSSWDTIFYWTNNQWDDNNWHYESFDLSDYLVSNFNLRFISKQNSSREEVEIDDILIKWIVSEDYNGDPVPNKAPIANAWEDKSVVLGNAISFNASLSHDPDWNIVSYTWDFGDWNTFTWVSVSHIYQSLWIFTATLTVVDDWWLLSQDTLQVIVTEEALLDLKITSLTTKDIRAWSRYEVNAFVVNNDTYTQTVVANLEILDPSWNYVFWNGMADKNKTINSWDVWTVRWRNKSSKSAELGTYTANVSLLKNWEILDSLSKAFEVYK